MNLEPVYILGSGGMAAELLTWVNMSNRYLVSGIVVKDKRSEAAYFKGIPCLELDDLSEAGCSVIVAVMDPVRRRYLFDRLESAGHLPLGFVSNNAIVADDSKIDSTAIICPNAIICPDTVISRGVFINTGATIGHNTVIGPFVSINGSCQISGYCRIEEMALLGSSVTIAPRGVIGSCSTVGTGSCVFGKIPSGVTVLGNPARKI